MERRKNILKTVKKNIEKLVLLTGGRTDYCLQTSIVIVEKLLQTTHCLLDTGSEPKFGCEEFPSRFRDRGIED